MLEQEQAMVMETDSEQASVKVLAWVLGLVMATARVTVKVRDLAKALVREQERA